MPLSRWALLLALVVLGPVQELASGTVVRLDGGRVIVQATGTPLTEVLSRFGEATGTKIVYDKGGKPRQLVTVEIDAGSAAEALTQLLEGQGLGYALRLDPSGRGVEMLLLAGKGQGSAPPTSTATAGERPASHDPAEMEPNLPTETEPVPGEPSPADEAKEQPAEPMGVASPSPTGVAAPSPTGRTPRGGAPFPSSWQPAVPSFPAPASYPAWR